MKCDKHTMLLYAVTDRAWVGEQTLYQQVESALKGGATCVQLREKQLGDADFLQEAIQIHALCQQYGLIPKAALAQKAIPSCGLTFVTGAEMKTGLSGYLQVMIDANPKSVGGALPGDNFYYGA